MSTPTKLAGENYYFYQGQVNLQLHLSYSYLGIEVLELCRAENFLYVFFAGYGGRHCLQHFEARDS
jgi:hypothetical protein